MKCWTQIREALIDLKYNFLLVTFSTPHYLVLCCFPSICVVFDRMTHLTELDKITTLFLIKTIPMSENLYTIFICIKRPYWYQILYTIVFHILSTLYLSISITLFHSNTKKHYLEALPSGVPLLKLMQL